MKIAADRIDANTAAPDSVKALMANETYLASSPLEPLLLELIKIRASQINTWNRIATGLRYQHAPHGMAAQLAMSSLPKEAA